MGDLSFRARKESGDFIGTVRTPLGDSAMENFYSAPLLLETSLYMIRESIQTKLGLVVKVTPSRKMPE